MGCKETLGGYGHTVRLHGLEISLMPGVVDPGRHEVEALLPEGGAERVPTSKMNVYNVKLNRNKRNKKTEVQMEKIGTLIIRR